jgi:regulator of sigma E protease
MNFLMNNTYFAIAMIVVGFGFLIFVHELGHFLVAKLVGIKTTQFAIGFGHSLLTWRKGIGFRVGTTEPEYEKLLAEGADPEALGETEYRLNYIPLGGYVKMLGQEDMDPSAQSKDPRAFNNKSISARLAVISAGVIMNIIFGMIFFIIAFMSGVKFNPAVVGSIAPLSPAATTFAQGHDGDLDYLGLRIGDRITQIDGEEVSDILDLKSAIILARDGSILDLTVERDAEPDGLSFKVKPKVDPLPGPNKGMLTIGIAPPVDLEVAPFGDVTNKLTQAGVTAGMRITAVDGRPVSDYADYHRALTAKQGLVATVTFTQPDSGKTAEITAIAYPTLVRAEDTPPNLLGLVPPVQIIEVLDKNPAKAAGIEAGDLIARVQGLAWPSMDEFRKAIKDADGKPISVTVLRDGREVKVDPVAPKRGQIGVAISLPDAPYVGQVLPGSPLDSAEPITGGSRLLAVNGQPLKNWSDLQRILNRLDTEAGEARVVLSFELNLANRPEETTTIALNEEAVSQLQRAAWVAPLPEGMPSKMLRVAVVGDDPAEAMAIGFEKTQQFIMQTYMTLLRLTQGSVPADKLSGPVGIVHQGTIIAEGGWEYLLFFLGLISINLAVINFLPIPITDGGLAVFLFAEKIKGSPVSARVQTAAMVAGLAVLGCVFLFVTYNDLLRIYKGL